MRDSNFISEKQQSIVSPKNVKFKSPLVIKDGFIMGGIFLCDYFALREIVPAQFQLLKLPFHQSMIGFYAVECRQSDIRSYNEVAILAIIDQPNHSRRFVPNMVRGAASFLTHQLYAYVVDLPVNNDVSKTIGVKFFNFPSTVKEIEFRETETHRVCTLSDPLSKDLLLGIECKQVKTKYIHQSKKKKNHEMFTCVDRPTSDPCGKFTINYLEMNEDLLMPAMPTMNIRFGQNVYGEELKKLKIGKLIHTIYAPHIEGAIELFGDDGRNYRVRRKEKMKTLPTRQN